jgi:hypothetical protein
MIPCIVRQETLTHIASTLGKAQKASRFETRGRTEISLNLRGGGVKTGYDMQSDVIPKVLYCRPQHPASRVHVQKYAKRDSKPALYGHGAAE